MSRVPRPRYRCRWYTLLCVGGGAVLGTLSVLPSLADKTAWPLLGPPMGAILSALVARFTSRCSPPASAEPSAEAGRESSWLPVAFLMLGPLVGGAIGYAIGYTIEDMDIFFPILSLGVFVGLIGFVACLIAG